MKHILLIAIALFLQASAGFAQEVGPEPGISGEHDFRLYCAACHGEDGRGGGPATYGLSVEPPDLTGLAQRNGGEFPQERIARLIDGREEVKAHGSREMPVWGDWFKLEAAEGLGGAAGGEATVKHRIAIIIDYLRSIQR
jgi:mono/diheme cytochrome c family protein